MNIFKINKEEMEKNVIHDFDKEEPEATKRSKNREPLANWAIIVAVLVLVSFAILLAVLAILKFSDKKEVVKEVTMREVEERFGCKVKIKAEEETDN